MSVPVSGRWARSASGERAEDESPGGFGWASRPESGEFELWTDIQAHRRFVEAESELGQANDPDGAPMRQSLFKTIRTSVVEALKFGEAPL